MANFISLISVDALTAPFAEEIAFRGVILEQLTRYFNRWTGIIGSALLFGLVHLLNGELTLTSALQLVLSGTLMGLLLALICVKEHSIWASYTVHACYNFIGDIIPAQVSITHDWPFELIFKNSHQLITGGQYGADCSLANVGAYLLMIIAIIYLFPKTKN